MIRHTKIDSVFNGLKMPPELACEFFAVFARFEFALKEGGYFTARDNRVSPDWDRFATWVGENLSIEADSELENEIANLLDVPPKVQIGPNDWTRRDLNGGSPASRAIYAIQRVRNNMFHGGKHTGDSSPGRDEMLVRASLVVLKACLSQCHELRSIYNQPGR